MKQPSIVDDLVRWQRKLNQLHIEYRKGDRPGHEILREIESVEKHIARLQEVRR